MVKMTESLDALEAENPALELAFMAQQLLADRCPGVTDVTMLTYSGASWGEVNFKDGVFVSLKIDEDQAQTSGRLIQHFVVPNGTGELEYTTISFRSFTGRNSPEVTPPRRLTFEDMFFFMGYLKNPSVASRFKYRELVVPTPLTPKKTGLVSALGATPLAKLRRSR